MQLEAMPRPAKKADHDEVGKKDGLLNNARWLVANWLRKKHSTERGCFRCLKVCSLDFHSSEGD